MPLYPSILQIITSYAITSLFSHLVTHSQQVSPCTCFPFDSSLQLSDPQIMSRSLPHISDEHMDFYLNWLLPQYFDYLNSKKWSSPPLTFLQLARCSSSCTPQDFSENPKICSISSSSSEMDDGKSSQLDDRCSIQVIPSTETFQPEHEPSDNIPLPFFSLPLPQLVSTLVLFGLLVYLLSAMVMILWNPILLITVMLLYWLSLTIFGTEVLLRLMSKDEI
jgi:hypothetical protein